MRQKLSTILIIVFLSSIFLSSIALANSISWDFTMNLRYVNGKDNGKTYSMTAGTMTLAGSIRPTSLDDYYLPSPYVVNVEVWKVGTIWDTSVGYASVTPNTDGTAKSFSKSLGSVTSGTYYIVAYKAEDDGWNISGSGTLTTN